MRTPTPDSRLAPSRPSRQGIALIDCLVYIAVTTLILGLSFATFIESVERTTELERVATTLAQALQAGERWREDIRSAQGAPKLEQVEGKTFLRIATARGEVSYGLDGSNVVRRASAEAPWLELVPHVQASAFVADSRPHVRAWRWDLELSTRRDRERFRRALTFLAVPPASSAPTPPR